MAMDSQKTKTRPIIEIVKRFTSSAPVDVEAMARALGISVIRDYLGPGVSAKIQRDASGKYTIVVNAADSRARQRFSIAHELAHYIYHRDLIGDGVADSPAYRAPDESVYETTPLERRHEWQANQFAANVLMPNELLHELERANPGMKISELAQRLDVSVPAMRVKKGLPPYPSGAEDFAEGEGDDPLAPLDGNPPF